MENSSLDDSLNRRKEFYLGMITKAIDLVYETKNTDYVGSVEGNIYQLSKDIVGGLEEVMQSVDAVKMSDKKKKNKSLPTQDEYNRLRDTGFSHKETVEYLNLPSLPGYFAGQYKKFKIKSSFDRETAKKRYYDLRDNGLNHRSAREKLENERFKLKGPFYRGIASAYAKYSNKQSNK